ncbi:MAG: DUF2784 family protein [Chloroflexota bacterium]|nr:DUF2784 family protein [Chloroflexota bacterium]
MLDRVGWFLADAVLTAHVLLLVVLGIGVVVAALGWMRRRPRVALVFWPSLVVTLGWQALPGCPLSDLERWLRRMEAPGWDRDMSIARTLSGRLTGVHPPETVFAGLAALLGAMAVYAFVRYHLGHAQALGAWVLRLRVRDS